MARHAQQSRTGGRSRRSVAGAAFAALGLAVTGTGVFAALNATAFNTTPQTVTSGTLELTLADNGAGFSQDISLMAPGDVVNRYVDVTNDGSLDGKDMTLEVADGTPTKLTTDATNGLHVTVSSCTGANWVILAGIATCAGVTNTVLNNVALSTLVATPQSIVSGAVATPSTQHLRMALTLPDQDETTINGTLPGGTIQGLSASLTWTFAETQRDAITTTS